jgi:cytochrome b6-f complex iron-sulfur subunit
MSVETPSQQEGYLSRRELLYYVWLSSIAAAAVGSGGALVAFSYPRFKEGEFGGKFVVGKAEDVAEGQVVTVREGKFFLTRQGGEFKAFYQVCTHLGCLLRETEDGFACPCHGSSFDANGVLISSPAPRDMDKFAVEVVDGNVVVDTGKRSKGQSRSV